MTLVTDLVLGLAALLCSLVAGFLFAFAVVVMPGIGRLDDAGFLRAFQAIDGVIQRGQPLFGLVWLGSALAVVAALSLGLLRWGGPERLLVVAAGAIYLLGVQLPTILVNIPLNNELQALQIDGSDGAGLARARAGFEPRWNRWNRIRTGLAVLTTALLIIVLAR